MAKILAVDDDLAILELYKEIFTKAGFEIHTAEDASNAMGKYQEVKPDLIILDVDMPAGGGQKVFDRLRNLLMTAVPIIFSTGSPENVAGLARNLNVIILKKPVNAAVMISAVNKLLKIPEKPATEEK
jgi:DNA-binding response OmpR family regulator